MKVRELAKKYEDQVIAWRREFHENPELSWEEVRTGNRICEELTKMNIGFKRIAKTGVLGILKGDKPGKMVALRADMDALPIKEANNDVPYKSKNDIKDNIYNELDKLFPGMVKFDVHSKCIRYHINYDNIKMQIEVNAELECDSTELSTVSLAKVNNQPGKIVRAMSYGQLLSHKLAAWNERELFRDLYDIYFLYDVLDEKPDIAVLKKRLKRIAPAKGKTGTKSMTLDEFLSKLAMHITNFSPKDLSEELKDYLTRTELAGLDKKIKIAVKSLISHLKKPA